MKELTKEVLAASCDELRGRNLHGISLYTNHDYKAPKTGAIVKRYNAIHQVKGVCCYWGERLGVVLQEVDTGKLRIVSSYTIKVLLT